MSFVHPAGLWALLGLVALLAAHFIRRRFVQAAVPSAYLWRLAQRCQKRREPARRVRRAALLALQALCVALCALLIAQPEIVLPGGKTALVAVLDASGSMRVADETGQTRFERAVRALEEDAASLPRGSRVSVVLAGDEASLAVEDEQPGAGLSGALSSLVCDYGTGDLGGAMALCAGLLEGGRASQVRLYTDREIERAEGLNVVDVRSGTSWNASITPVSAERTGQGMRLRATVGCAGRDADVSLGVLVDGVPPDDDRVTLSVDGEAQDGLTVHIAAGETAQIAVSVSGMKPESSAVLRILAGDGLAQDDEARFCGRPVGTTRVLLTGGDPYFLRMALLSLDEVALEYADVCENPAPTGYNVYVYDGCMPDVLPEGAAVWLIDPPGAPEGTGVALGETILGGAIRAEAAEGAFAALTADMALSEAAASRVREVVSCGRLMPVLRCGELPLLLAGRKEDGAALLLLACGVQSTSLPMSADFLALVRNLLAFSAPQPFEAQHFVCGHAPALSWLPACERMLFQAADRSIQALDGQLERVYLREPGVYSVIAQLADGRERLFSLEAHMPPGEGTDADEPLLLALPEPNAQALSAREQRVPALCILAAALLLLLIVEWGLDERERV